MGRIKELIKSFINPAPQEQSFEELAVAAGIGEADLNALKKSMGGVKWKFDGEESKKDKSPKTATRENQVPTEPKKLRTNNNIDMDIER